MSIPIGTIRIKRAHLQPVEKTSYGWKKSYADLNHAIQVAKLFRAHKNIKAITSKEPKFLKGQISSDGKIQGARITVLPDGTRVDKAYSLFADSLHIHDQSSHDHWDVLFKNPGGTYAYVYALEKKEMFSKSKYRKVQAFSRHFPSIKRRCAAALRDSTDEMAVPMYTLLKTYMRIGNEIYYRASGHKGLTTLKKKDITIKGDMVEFKFLSKSGIPRSINERFPKTYVKRLRMMLRNIGNQSFVFTNSNGHPMRDTQFKSAFKRYCGHEFYPHIIRSYYATTKAKEFLKTHRKASKKEVRCLYTEMASKLGHMKFDKKKHVWKESFNTTIRNYIQPDVVKRLNSIVS